jgi:hypothetical protein
MHEAIMRKVMVRIQENMEKADKINGKVQYAQTYSRS